MNCWCGTYWKKAERGITVDDYQKMMEQALEMQQKMMEEMQQKALAQHRKMCAEMGVEPDEEELLAEFAQQAAAEAAIMQQGYAGLAGAMAGYEVESEDDEEDEGMSEEEIAAFLQANAVSPEQARYLPIGALLIGTHDEPYETLALTQSPEYTEMVLEGGWDISSREEGLEMLESLLGGRHATRFAEAFQALQSGDTEELDEEDIDDYETCAEAIVEVLELPKSLVEGCKTLLAWDLERVGYLARLFVNAGYLSQEEAWDWMKKAGALIKEHFSSWEEYMVSLLMGRAMAMGIHQEPFAVALDLLTDSKAFLEAHPITSL